MKLSKLLEGVEVLNEYQDIEIANIESDSRKVKENTLFICLKGENNDGHDYINQAIESGAIAIVVNEEYGIYYCRKYDKFYRKVSECQFRELREYKQTHCNTTCIRWSLNNKLYNFTTSNFRDLII